MRWILSSLVLAPTVSRTRTFWKVCPWTPGAWENKHKIMKEANKRSGMFTWHLLLSVFGLERAVIGRRECRAIPHHRH